MILFRNFEQKTNYSLEHFNKYDKLILILIFTFYHKHFIINYIK